MTPCDSAGQSNLTVGEFTQNRNTVMIRKMDFLPFRVQTDPPNAECEWSPEPRQPGRDGAFFFWALACRATGWRRRRRAGLLGLRRRRRRTRGSERRWGRRIGRSSCSRYGAAQYRVARNRSLDQKRKTPTPLLAHKLLTRRSGTALAQEKLFKAIDEKKTVAAAAIRQQQEQEEQDAARTVAASRTKTNVYGDPVQVRPHISPRTKRLSRQHLKSEGFAGNYGQRLYQYGVTDFRKVRLLFAASATHVCYAAHELTHGRMCRVPSATRRERRQAARDS